VTRPAPCVGEHNREVLSGVLGYETNRIDQLEASGVLK